ncbi:MAG: anti-sigma factor, partial [Verrucomicrobia bacterium]|nr:anti-sigma factor [Cytophagales bacterium]
MNIEEYISSGILESYVLGATSPQETDEVEDFARQYPEINAEIEAIRNGLEDFALTFEENPPPNLRDKVLGQLALFSAEEKTNLHSVVETKAITKTVFFRPWMSAAAVILLAVSLAVNMFLFNNLKDTEQKLAAIENQNQAMAVNLQTTQSEYQALQMDVNVLQNPETQAIMLKGMNKAASARVKVYWNKEQQTVLIGMNELPMPPSGMQYQLWIIVDDKPVDAGMIDMHSQK